MRFEKIIRDFSKALAEPQKKRTSAYDSGGTVTRIEDGTAWVKLAGSKIETPVRLTIACQPGDEVQVRVGNGTAWLCGNGTAPPTDDRTANVSYKMAEKADEKAVKAQSEAALAFDASRAAAKAANEAQEEAGRAKKAADAAQESADDAKEAADAAQEEAIRAKVAAGDAQQSANEAAEAAADAKGEAQKANKHASAALDQLSIVEDVVGTLSWITEHATYKATPDTEVQAGKYYFTKSGSSYNVVINPTGNPKTNGYYEIDSIDEAVSNYVASHLALTNAGLWVINDGNSYKILLSGDGMDVYDDAGALVSSFGENITFNSDRPQRIGGDDVYIEYYDSDDDGKADSLRIVGAQISSVAQINDRIEDLESRQSESLTFDVIEEELTSDTIRLNAVVYQNGEDIHESFSPDAFLWNLKSESGTTRLGTGYSVTVSRSSAKYGGEVEAEFMLHEELLFVLPDEKALEFPDSRILHVTV